MENLLPGALGRPAQGGDGNILTSSTGVVTPASTSLAPAFVPFEGQSFLNSESTAGGEACFSAVDDAGLGRAPRSYMELLGALTTSRCLAELGMKLAWGYSQNLVTLGNSRARPTRATVREKGGLFPLPVMIPSGLDWDAAGLKCSERSGLSVQCWTAVACEAINALYGLPNVGKTRVPTKIHRAVLAGLEDKVCRFLHGDSVPDFNFFDAVKDLREKRLSYTGEEIQPPHPLSAAQIIKGLPPVGHGGAIPVTPFLKGRTRFLMEHPEESLLPECDRGTAPVTAKVHVEKGGEVEIFSLLYERGIVDWIPADQAFCDSRGTYLSGLFGVVKPGRYTPCGKPVLRVIMNLVPVNALFRVLQGDIHLLPNATQWLPLCISQGDEIFLSQGDMASAFYLFSIPPCWQPYLCFNFKIQGCKLGLSSLEDDVWYRPTCRVLPMGWSSSVGIMQAISREILLAKGLPPELELKKGGKIPPWFAQVASADSPQRAWWQVYLDNFMSGEVDRGGEPGISIQLQDAAMRAWSTSGVLTAEDKQVLGSREATELGVRFDGARGLLGASPHRLLKTIFVTLHHILCRRWSKREAQMVLGRWIFILQFRRAAMGVLSRAWQVIEKPWPSFVDINILRKELLQLIFLGPLIQSDLTSHYDGEVTCSDASESGGACAVATSLTWSGNSLVGSLSDRRLLPIECPFLIVSLFNGIGGAFRLYDVLGIHPVGRISVEIDKYANRVTRSTWPNVLELHDVELIDKAEVQRWAEMYPHVQELHFYAGFPCIHLSSVRAYRQNLDGEGSRLFWKMLEILLWIQEVFSPFCKVKFCVENVASMDESARRAISDELEVCPIKLDPSDILPFSRPRFAWTSEPLYEMQGIRLVKEKEYVRAYMEGDTVANSQWIRPGWSWTAPPGTCFPTFMKSIRRRRPPPQPAGLSRTDEATRNRWQQHEFRYPPYQYRECFLLSSPGRLPRVLDSSERELLLGFGPGHTATCMSASEMKRSLTDYEDIRCSLNGDSFSILSFAVIASSFSAEFVPRLSPDKIVKRLGLAPGASIHPCTEVPMSRWLSYGGDPERQHQLGELVRHLGLTINHTGADVRICTGEVLTHKAQSHASARAWWWQWKHLFKIKWLFKSHINYLEMKMILHTLLWKSRSISKINCRWLHLEDSMVCLYILSKGRTSSHLLQPLCNQIGAVQLAMGSVLLHSHVSSSENPTDAASRD